VIAVEMSDETVRACADVEPVLPCGRRMIECRGEMDSLGFTLVSQGRCRCEVGSSAVEGVRVALSDRREKCYELGEISAQGATDTQ
jgi:hypothetical protein